MDPILLGLYRASSLCSLGHVLVPALLCSTISSNELFMAASGFLYDWMIFSVADN